MGSTISPNGFQTTASLPRQKVTPTQPFAMLPALTRSTLLAVPTATTASRQVGSWLRSIEPHNTSVTANAKSDNKSEVSRRRCRRDNRRDQLPKLNFLDYPMEWLHIAGNEPDDESTVWPTVTIGRTLTANMPAIGLLTALATWWWASSSPLPIIASSAKPASPTQ
jgi:hypothetical protein